MGAPEGGLRECARGWGQTRTSGGSACVLKAMFPLITCNKAARWLAATQPHTASRARCIFYLPSRKLE